MASIKVPDSEYIRELKRLQPNTYKLVCYVVEFWDKTLPQGCGYWVCATARNSVGAYPVYSLCGLCSGYSTSKAAAASMRYLQERYPSYSCRISRYPLSQALADQVVANSIWEKREASRMIDGTYTPLPWADELWFKDAHASYKHFAHVSIDKDGLIAFTENSDKGAADIQKRMNPGRYLKEYYTQALWGLKPFETGATNVNGEKVTISPIAHYARLFSTTYGDTCELKFATDSETMIEVYQKGPDSCMTFRGNDYAGDEHPVTVYAAGDLNLAYLIQPDGEITARALVWPEKLMVGRTYGDSATLISKLQELGYQAPTGYSDIVGARMLKIAYGDCYIMPFLDACNGYYHSSDCGEFWIIGRKSPGTKNYESCAIHQHGLSSKEEEEEAEDDDVESICHHCDATVPYDDTYEVTIPYYSPPVRGGSEIWCHSCCETHAFTCTESEEIFSNQIPHIVLAALYRDSPQYVAVVNAGNYFKCAVNGGWYHKDDAVGIYEYDVSALVSKDASESLVRVESDNSYVVALWYRPDHLPDQLKLELDEVAA